MKATSKQVKKSKWRCEGGPFDGSVLLLVTPNTLPFSVGAYAGYYMGAIKVAHNTKVKDEKDNFIWTEIDQQTADPVKASHLIWVSLTKEEKS